MAIHEPLGKEALRSSRSTQSFSAAWRSFLRAMFDLLLGVFLLGYGLVSLAYPQGLWAVGIYPSSSPCALDPNWVLSLRVSGAFLLLAAFLLFRKRRLGMLVSGAAIVAALVLHTGQVRLRPVHS